MQKVTLRVYFSKYLLFIFLLGIALPFPAFSSGLAECHKAFEGSRRGFELSAIEESAEQEGLLPQFKSIEAEIEQVQHWTSKVPDNLESLTAILPQAVSFVNHRLRESRSPSVVKFPAQGSSLILRAEYSSQAKELGTNVTLSKVGLMENFISEKKWLIGKSAQAGILFLHGGGTKSTGGHVAENIINHFHKYNIAVISPDLPWHGEGPRTFMGNLDDEIQALSDFTKKYVHPDVPLFIWGHSWGGSIAHRIMQMSGERESAFFHKNLKGLIITSPAVDPAPGKPLNQKIQIARDRAIKAMELEHKVAPTEQGLFIQMVEDGKTSPVGEFFSSLTISQLNDTIPSHQGDKYLPALMLVGVGDQLVYLGFEDLFHNYYDKLTNVSAHYLDELPLFISKNGEKQIVGHLLSDYVTEEDFKNSNRTPVNFKMALDFMSEHTEIKEVKKDKTNAKSDLFDILQLYANDLSFRKWVEKAKIIKDMKTHSYQKVQKELAEKKDILKTESFEYLPSKSFSNSLEYFIEEIKKVSSKEEEEALIKRIKSWSEKYRNSFAYDRGLEGFFDLLKSAGNMEEVQNLISEKFLKHPIIKNHSEKQKNRFLNEILSIESQEDFKRFEEKHSYITRDVLQVFYDQALEIQKLNKRMQGTYIPTKLDYEKAVFLNFPEDVEQRIDWIRDNVEKRRDLNSAISQASQKISELKVELNKNLDKVSQLARKMRMFFEDSAVDPPHFLKEDYEHSQKKLLALYDLSEKVRDKLDSAAYDKLEKNEFSLEGMKEIFVSQSENIENFVKEYDQYMEDRVELRKKLIEAAREGKLSNEIQKLVDNLYGPLGLYNETENISVQLAKEESKRIKLLNETVQLVRDYNKWIPFEELFIMESIPVKNILNLPVSDEAALEKHQSEVAEIKKSWRYLGSRIPVELPL